MCRPRCEAFRGTAGARLTFHVMDNVGYRRESEGKLSFRNPIQNEAFTITCGEGNRNGCKHGNPIKNETFTITCGGDNRNGFIKNHLKDMEVVRLLPGGKRVKEGQPKLLWKLMCSYTSGL